MNNRSKIKNMANAEISKKSYLKILKWIVRKKNPRILIMRMILLTKRREFRMQKGVAS